MAKKRDGPEDFDYIEGTIVEFPEMLKTQIEEWYKPESDVQELVSPRWSSKGSKKQSLTQSADGRQRKYAIKNSLDAARLEVGRFWYSDRQQIIVVGVPDSGAQNGTRYAAITPYPGWYPCTTGWMATRWSIWKPTEEKEYYRALPAFIWRLQGSVVSESTTAEAQKSPTAEPNAVITSSEQRDKFAQADDASPKPESVAANIVSTYLKRKASPEAASDSVKQHKIARLESEDKATATLTTTEVLERLASTGDDGVEQSLNVGNAPASPNTRSASPKETVENSSLEKTQSNQDVNIPSPEQTQPSSETAADNEPSSRHLHGAFTTSRDTDESPVTVKQEEIHTATPIFPSPNSTLVSKKAPKARAKSQMLVAHRETSFSATPLSIDSPSQRTNAGIIDLTVTHDNNSEHGVMPRDVTVIFVDEYDRQQHATPFDDCKTARQLFEEACAWEVANKDTRMLEICIIGCNAARVSRDNEKHFEQKILQPLKEIIKHRNNGEVTTLKVRKYM